MSQDIQSLLPELKRLADAATPGPWRWELNEKNKTVDLVGGRPEFDKTVMDFVRYGMGHAAPRFNSAIAGGKYNIMERAEFYGKTVSGRAHHASWFKDINHPDAILIAAANPATLSALIAYIEALERELEGARASMKELAKRVFHDQNQQLREGDQFAVPRLLMILCETCGNKRCPHANDKANACTGSNEPGQPGSAYP